MSKEVLPDKVKEFRELYMDELGFCDDWFWSLLEEELISISKLPNIGILNEYKKIRNPTWTRKKVIMLFCEFLLKV